MVYVIIIKHAKFSYSSIESQLLPCAPACGQKFHAIAVYLNPHLQLFSNLHLQKLSITRVTQGNLGLTLPPDSLDLHQMQNPKIKYLTDSTSSFHFPEIVQVFSNPTHITKNQQKPTTIGLTICKYSTCTKLRRFACGRSAGKLLDPWYEKEHLELTPPPPPHSLDQHQNHKSWVTR